MKRRREGVPRGAHDLTTFIAVPALLGGVALIASWIQARRAAHVDPLKALRSD